MNSWKACVFTLVCAAMLGCGGSASTGCEKLKECDDTINVDECIRLVEDAVNDGRISQEDLDRCVDCLDSNSCGELAAGDCGVACSAVL